ncbi:MAG: hypothetical protein HXX12_08345 [Geothrix sp.]|uniref:hypothetical protein n=1 Tax=Geothrix sp. TaxID=1962974 RepID=UPI00180CAA2D|nr:hypothetical protein [Geothrix sp.]NWJ40968.1 hypothetical protein [Geothrix sp.]WIL21036.1 MAG: hypothetical protein QOZ81_000280 [Geothrix sp.]
MVENEISVIQFTQESLVDLVCGASASGNRLVPPQVKYLARYCERLGVKTLVHERHYIDRHFMDEYANYYSRKLEPPPNFVQRVHFFAHAFSDAQLAQWLRKGFASPTDRQLAEREIQAPPGGTNLSSGYCGYSSIRPIQTVPLGRTIIVRLPDEEGPERQIWTTNSHSVHLGNLRLTVEGLAFQQQDAAVGACATAALWSALDQVARHDGIRAPTPAEITEAAVRGARSGGRSMLSASVGLTLLQLCEATRGFGFTPEVLSPLGHPEYFFLALHTYLASGIPVVLGLVGEAGRHAVTAAGFQLSGSDNATLSCSIPVRSSRLNKIYIHDDRVGPYARAFIKPIVFPPKDSRPGPEGVSLDLELEDGVSEQWVVECAVVPVYPKLRLPVSSLISIAESLASGMELVVGKAKAPALRVDLRYQRAGEYLKTLSGRLSNPGGAGEFVRKVSLSRWCAIVRWSVMDTPVADFVFDTTDVLRNADSDVPALLRCIVSLSTEFQGAIEQAGAGFKVPTV